MDICVFGLPNLRFLVPEKVKSWSPCARFPHVKHGGAVMVRWCFPRHTEPAFSWTII